MVENQARCIRVWGHEEAERMGRLGKKVQGLKNPTINGWEEEDELKRRLTAIGEGVDKSEDKLVLIEFISMAVIDNLYFQVPCWDFCFVFFKKMSSCKYDLF